MNFVVKVVLLLTYVTMTIQHEAYPPGIPPPNMQAHGHQQQHQQNLQFQQAQHGQGQQQFHGQGQQQFQGQGQQQFQGHQNTQQFQQQQPPQHQQQQQFQQQQHHQQQQQQQHGGGHHHPGGHQGFGQNQMVHDADHIKEHLKEVVDKPKEEMSEEELEFHYFKLHDYDSNNRLDGTEIVKAITHFHEEGEQQHEASPDAQQQKKVFSDEELVNIVDLVLKEDDLNLDGYIEYAEFVTAQRRARANEQKDGDKK